MRRWKRPSTAAPSRSVPLAPYREVIHPEWLVAQVVDWGSSTYPMVTLNALRILRSAGRLAA